MSNNNQSQTVTLIKGDRIGSGSFSIVYKATEQHSGRVVALKKGRVSLLIKHTLFQHEAATLKTLRGHPSIPDAFAYGRIEHFELLSMPLYDQCLDDLMSESSPLPVPLVLHIMDQLLSSLEHIHSHKIVHRDIKPSNIMVKTKGSWDIVLIDFGLVYRPSSLREEPSSEEQKTVFGTLSYASLYAHKHSYLSYRDDLESLIYTLIFLYKGNLPWTYHSRHGTYQGRIRQVLEQKKRFNGQQLAYEVPILGMLHDHARSLSANVVPNYEAWRDRLKQYTWPGGSIEPWRAQRVITEEYDHNLPPPPPPIEVGQVVQIRLLSAVSIEEYTENEKGSGNPVFIHDPSFKGSEWHNPALPAIVLNVSWNEHYRIYRFSAVAIAQWEEGPILPSTVPPIPILSAEPDIHTPQIERISTQPTWPWKNTFCYAFQRPARFYCLPSQQKIHSSWKVDTNDVDLLVQHMWPRTGPSSLLPHDAIRCPDIDVRDDSMVRTSNARLYAEITPLDISDGPGIRHTLTPDWHSSRAWHDEIVKATRQWDYDAGKDWNIFAHLHERKIESDPDEVEDSYFQDDYSLWTYLRQQERDKTLTLSTSNTGERFSNSLLQDLDNINLVEEI